MDADAGGVVDGVADGGGGGDGGDFADALCAVRAVGGGFFDDDGGDLGGVFDAGHFVAGEGVGEGDALLDDVFFGEGVAEAHDDAAFDLALEADGVDGAADVVGGDDFEDVDFAGVEVYFDEGGLGGEAEGDVHVAAGS